MDGSRVEEPFLKTLPANMDQEGAVHGKESENDGGERILLIGSIIMGGSEMGNVVMGIEIGSSNGLGLLQREMVIVVAGFPGAVTSAEDSAKQKLILKAEGSSWGNHGCHIWLLLGKEDDDMRWIGEHMRRRAARASRVAMMPCNDN